MNAATAPKFIYTCPSTKRCEDDVVGCGASFEAVPDHDGLIDCPECGMWFRADGTAN